MMGDLRQKYFEYERIIRKPETIYWYNDRSIKHEQMAEICLQAWQYDSLETTQHELLKADEIRKSSPIAARKQLERLLNAEEDFSFDGKVNEKIKVFPLTNEHKKLIQDKIDHLSEECDKEAKALQAWNEGAEAKDALVKLEKFLSARGFFPLPGIDQQIYDQIFPATRSRQIYLQSQIDSLENRLQAAKNQNEEGFLWEIEDLIKDVKALISESKEWPHIGEKVTYSQEGEPKEYLIDFPEEILTVQENAQVLQVKINECKTAFESFIRERAEIISELNVSEKHNVAIEKWKNLSQNPRLMEFRLFIDFSVHVNNFVNTELYRTNNKI